MQTQREFAAIYRRFFMDLLRILGIEESLLPASRTRTTISYKIKPSLKLLSEGKKALNHWAKHSKTLSRPILAEGRQWGGEELCLSQGRKTVQAQTAAGVGASSLRKACLQHIVTQYMAKNNRILPVNPATKPYNSQLQECTSGKGQKPGEIYSLRCKFTEKI